MINVVKFARALAEEPTARRAVERMLREVAADYTDPAHPPGCLIISATAAHGPGSYRVAEDLHALREATKKTIEARIEEGVRLGQLPAGSDVGALTTFYAATIQGMSRQAQDGATKEDLERVAALAMQAWPVS